MNEKSVFKSLSQGTDNLITMKNSIFEGLVGMESSTWTVWVTHISTIDSNTDKPPLQTPISSLHTKEAKSGGEEEENLQGFKVFSF